MFEVYECCYLLKFIVSCIGNFLLVEKCDEGHKVYWRLYIYIYCS